MTVKLKAYQEKAVSELQTAAAKLLSKPGSGKICVFQAPTGSGKTLMTATFLERLMKETSESETAFVWVTIGKGELHIQTHDHLKGIFGVSPKVSLVEHEFAGGRDVIEKNEIVVVNWEKLRSKHSRTGEWKNTLMKDGEQTSFREVLANTRERRNVVLIIDESHIGATAERTNELRTEIDADLIVEMSATPRITPDPKDVARGLAAFVFVEPKDVIDEGMIKKELVINEHIDAISDDESDSQQVVLEAAFRKRLQLRALFDKEKSKVNPLVLVQIPTAEAGLDKIRAVTAFLARKNITERKDGQGNGKLAIWLAEQKSDALEWISQPDNGVEYLIFKQAIDTGWDCPRAHILVKFRETHSETFEIQTVGRILRMPEQRHYPHEDLNRGFIYTNVQSVIVRREEYNPNIIKHLKAKRIPTYKPLKLPAYYRSRVDYGDITSSFTAVFEKVACEHFKLKGDHTLYAQNVKKVESTGIVLDIKRYQQEIISDAKISGETFDEVLGRIDAATRAKLSIAGNDLDALFERVIRDHLGSFKNVKRSIPAVRSAIYTWFQRYLGSQEWPEQMLLIQKIVVHNGNRPTFEAILSRAIDQYRGIRAKEIEQKTKESEQSYDFDVPTESFFNQYADERVSTQGYVFDPCYLNSDRSRPERRFDDFLRTQANLIHWWWKNGEGKQDYFGIRYEYPEGDAHVFYPDYLVQLKDGRVFILEVKDADDRDGDSYTKAKAEALQSYLKLNSKHKLGGGIAIERNRTWLLNAQETYEWQKCLHGDWSDWTPLTDHFQN